MSARAPVLNCGGTHTWDSPVQRERDELMDVRYVAEREGAINAHPELADVATLKVCGKNRSLRSGWVQQRDACAPHSHKFGEQNGCSANHKVYDVRVMCHKKYQENCKLTWASHPLGEIGQDWPMPTTIHGTCIDLIFVNFDLSCISELCEPLAVYQWS